MYAKYDCSRIFRKKNRVHAVTILMCISQSSAEKNKEKKKKSTEILEVN